ncbi:MAG: N-acetylmuramic acid 6-phosphate etherase, partial [Clostridiales bacterium]|nr:N-acetylmuramic acid 6-phosphate etherase [Clostridiales bacterium]
LSILMIISGEGKDRAKEVLDINNGYIAKALSYIQNNK